MIDIADGGGPSQEEDIHISQSLAIAQHLESGQSLTALQALDWFGCSRLAARICDLRAKGYNIKTVPVVKKHKGVTKRWARYVLA